MQKEAINASAATATDNYCKAKEHLHARRSKNNTTANEKKKELKEKTQQPCDEGWKKKRPLS